MISSLLLLLAPTATIQLDVDATDAGRGIFHVRQSVSMPAGNLRLTYPKWIPGEHGPSGPIFDVVDIHARADGKEVAWRRDPLDLYTLDLTASLPRGPHNVEIRFDYVAARHSVWTPNLARVKWNRLMMLPAGARLDQQTIAAKLKVPSGWSIASPYALGTPVTAERLIDSPAVIGRYHQTAKLDVPGNIPISLEAFAEQEFTLTEATKSGHARLMDQALKLFGAAHFDHYQWLLTLSDFGAGEGLEHHECSEDGLKANGQERPEELGYLEAHELAHSWNGKFRRPLGLATNTLAEPFDDSDLWVYEGLTEWLGDVLSARSGFWSPEFFRDAFASFSDSMASRSGRKWRSIEDTAIFGSLINSGPDAWGNRRRGPDYYTEMVMVWMEADTIIRTQSQHRKSLDDFLRAFHGGTQTGPKVEPYRRKDVYEALNRVQPYDWPAFFESRVLRVQPASPVAWLEAAGWRLVYNETPNEAGEKIYSGDGFLDLLNSVGLSAINGEVNDVDAGSPADRAGIAPGVKIVAVNGEKFDVPTIRKAIAAKKAFDLLLDENGRFRTVTVDYTAGARYPHLERVTEKLDLLTPVITAK